ncbi:permease prefix domain 1-containing protein [Geomicrobium sp. JCM 19039]|uniref:permease prefix domain 1-containing protein n=1 Tax=Geomicrobium sp. JCM 19039 TaxID=1460636 RepID=UPI00045F3033|nr:permease prefix domain 1-containing protein [Geomicrobium sp. JCM 19039]GAK11727.1 hypothetical protein JCM19039_1442 [Geomicrobium sp. JCM 19039]
MNRIRAHVESLFRDIHHSEEKEILIEEITENLTEKVHDLVQTGKSREDAVNKAIVEFGDAEELKEDLRMKHPESKETTRKHRAKLNLYFSLWGSALIILLFIFINFYYTPNTIWFIFPTFAILWWPLAMTFVYKRTGEE